MCIWHENKNIQQQYRVKLSTNSFNSFTESELSPRHNDIVYKQNIRIRLFFYSTIHRHKPRRLILFTQSGIHERWRPEIYDQHKVREDWKSASNCLIVYEGDLWFTNRFCAVKTTRSVTTRPIYYKRIKMHWNHRKFSNP